MQQIQNNWSKQAVTSMTPWKNIIRCSAIGRTTTVNSASAINCKNLQFTQHNFVWYKRQLHMQSTKTIYVSTNGNMNRNDCSAEGVI